MFRRNLSSNQQEKPWILGDRKIHLHLGAHKTATTYIQKNLATNKATLLDHGVLYLSLPDTRARLSKHLVALSKSARDEALLAEHREAVLDGLGREDLARCHTVLISDENLSGGPGGFIKGKIYTSLAEKWHHVHDELGPNIQVSFSIRDYPGFLTSIYSEILRNHRYRRFGKIRGLFGEIPTLWSSVHADLSTVFGAENVTLWDFKDTVAHPAKVLAFLTGIDAPMEIIDEPVRESLSDRAIGFIRDFRKLPGRPLPAAVIAEVARRLYPLKDHPKKFDPWETDERAALLAHYQAEKARLPVRKF
ncbi:MAG: hypothetical protein ABIS50_18850 [Luteolibacter sp.]|uniref:hypothetical protein n=1 Tax=Luteolibacter sp. TaxID=1962973 RepID=UPI0032673C0C